MTLPPPTSFAEGQRQLYGILAAGAGMFCGAMAIGMICLLMWGNWSPKEEHTIVVIFGWTLGGFVASMAAVIVGLLTGGPVGRFKLNAGKEGVGIETDAAVNAPLVTTTTTVAPPSQPATTEPPS
jgi:hypothetical protein